MKSTAATLHLANDAATGAAVVLMNDGAIGDDGWAMLAPYCDKVTTGTPANIEAFRSHFQGLRIGNDGSVEVIQRVDRESATRLAEDFNGVLGKVKRFFRGAPIFLGHPDVPSMQDRYADKGPKGLIQRLEARDDGLYCLPVFNESGADLLLNKPRLGLSAHWDGEPALGDDGRLVFRPTRFISAGLTTTPNLPVTLLNSKPPEMDIKKLIALIAGLNVQGITLANDATEEQVAAAIRRLGEAISSSVTLANERGALADERDQLRTELANERKASRDALLAAALADGRISVAEQPLWESRLTAAFANESAALAALPPRYRTTSQTSGERRNTSPHQEAGAQLIALANAKMASGEAGDWNQAWTLACTEKPALLEVLSQPKA